MNRTICPLTATLLACIMFVHANGSLLGNEPFVEAYLIHEAKLYQKYSHNRKAVCRAKSYRLEGSNAVLIGSGETTTVSSDRSSRSNHVSEFSSPPSRRIGGDLRTRDDDYWLGQGDKPNQYKIERQRPKRPVDTDNKAFGASDVLTLPLTYHDAMLVDKFGIVLRTLGKSDNPTGRRDLVSVQDSTWQGQPAKAVRIKGQFDLHCTTYLDPSNDLAILGFETDGNYDAATRKKGPVRLLGTVTYASSAEGILLPTKSEAWFIMPDGRKLPSTVVEITEYSKYTPTADDFDLEKQFGVKPLPPLGTGTGANLTASRRLGWWLYGGAALFALLTAGLIIMRRRRRAASSAPQ